MVFTCFFHRLNKNGNRIFSWVQNVDNLLNYEPMKFITLTLHSITPCHGFTRNVLKQLKFKNPTKRWTKQNEKFIALAAMYAPLNMFCQNTFIHSFIQQIELKFVFHNKFRIYVSVDIWSIFGNKSMCWSKKASCVFLVINYYIKKIDDFVSFRRCGKKNFSQLEHSWSLFLLFHLLNSA